MLISDLSNPDGSPCVVSSEGEDEDNSEEGSADEEEEDSGAEIEDDQEGYDDDCGGSDEDFDDPDSELEELAEKEETRKRNCTEKQVGRIVLDWVVNITVCHWFGRLLRSIILVKSEWVSGWGINQTLHRYVWRTFLQPCLPIFC